MVVKWSAFLLVIEPPNPHQPMKGLNVQKKKKKMLVMTP
jgi:hypothetical protein